MSEWINSNLVTWILIWAVLVPLLIVAIVLAITCWLNVKKAGLRLIIKDGKLRITDKK